MSTKEILLAPTGTFTKWQKEKLAKEGYIVAEVDNPESVRILQQKTQDIEPNDLFMSALLACKGYATADKFTEELYKRLKAKEALSQTTPTNKQ